MRLLADQDVYALTVRFLRDSGHDVATAVESGLSTATDAALLQAAVDERRLLVTRDRDFWELIHEQTFDARALWFRPSPPSALKALHEELDRVLRLYDAGEVAHAFVVIAVGRRRRSDNQGVPHKKALQNIPVGWSQSAASGNTDRVEWNGSGASSRWWWFEGHVREKISIRSDIHFGKPCVAGTRITVRNIVELVRQRVAPLEVCRDYYPELSPGDIRSCVHDSWVRWPAYAFHRLAAWYRRRSAERRNAAWADDAGICCRWWDGEVTPYVTWDNLCSVEIETTDWGPWQEDFWLNLGRLDGTTASIPLHAKGWGQVWERLHLLPGFDDEADTLAWGSTANRVFPCWRRENPTDIAEGDWFPA